MKHLFYVIAVSVVVLATDATADIIGMNQPQREESILLQTPAQSDLPVAQMEQGNGPGTEFNYHATISYDLERSLTSECFPRLGSTLTFPEDSDTAGAIRRMARGQVTHWYHYCARTMREAMGFGLGDAHDWLALPEYGYTQRDTDMKARPGDILVWPFTYGARNTQHIGIAVDTPHGLRLLSNMNGRIQLDEIKPGYRAFWHNKRMMAGREEEPHHG